MKYLQPSFSVNSPGTQKYRDNWDAIFAPKVAPVASGYSPTENVLKLVPTVDEFTAPVVKVRHPNYERAKDFIEDNGAWWAGSDYDDIREIDRLASLLAPLIESSPIRKQVEEFMHAFNMPVLDKPQTPPADRVRLRLRLITEEYCELLESTGKLSEILKEMLLNFCNVFDETDTVDLVAFADACGDLDYVVEGARLEFGIDGAPIAAEVHKSNMSKLVDGQPTYRPDGKVAKPETYSPADVKGELHKQGWNG